jgi:hypothetical protein
MNIRPRETDLIFIVAPKEDVPVANSSGKQIAAHPNNWDALENGTKRLGRQLRASKLRVIYW